MLDTANIQQIFLYQAELTPIDVRVLVIIFIDKRIDKPLIGGTPLWQLISFD
jgi:hypothetical protein